MRKNILIVVPTLRKGGMERQLSVFLEYYDRSKFKITLALLRLKVEYVVPEDVKIICLNKKKRGELDLKFYWNFFKLLNDEKWDIIHSKLCGLNELVMFFCGCLRKKKAIVEIRNSGKKLHRNYKQIKFLLQIFRRQQDWRVLTNSNKALKEITDIFGTSAISVDMIPNAIDTNKFKKKYVKNNAEKFIIGFVGRITPAKNIEILIEAINYLDHSIYLRIYGNIDDEEYLAKLNSMIDDYGLKDLVEFYMAVDEIQNIYNSFDLFALPSHHEGTPNVLLEAMACECGCLISEGANSDNFLDDCFVFDERKSASLIQKILFARGLSSDEMRIAGKKNRDYVKANFSIENTVCQYQTIYEQM